VKRVKKISIRYTRWKLAESQLLETLISLTTHEKPGTGPESKSDTDWSYIARREAVIYLTKNREDYFYSVYDCLCRKMEHGFWQSQVKHALASLQSEGYIQSHDGGRGHRGQPTRRSYCITLLGLLKALTYNLSPNDFHLIAEKNVDKAPLIFGEWGYFEKNGVAKMIVLLIRSYYLYILESILEGSFESTNIRQRRKLGLEYHSKRELDTSALTRYILFARLPWLNSRKLETVDPLEETINESFRKMSLEWIKIWVGNPTLKLYLVDQLNRKQKVTEGVLTRVRELQCYINDTRCCEELQF